MVKNTNGMSVGAILEEVRSERSALVEKLRQLTEVEAYLSGKLGLSQSGGAAGEDESENESEEEYALPPEKKPLPQRKHRFFGLNRHEASAAVLRESGRPMKTTEIGDILLAAGMGNGLTRARFLSSIFTGMARHPDVFVKTEAGTWSLAKSAAE